MEQQKPKIIEEAIGSLEGVVTTQSEKLEAKIVSSTSFGKAFWPSVAASLAFFLVAAIIAFAWASQNRDTMRSFLNDTAVPIQDANKPE